MQNFWKAYSITALILFLTLSPSENFPEVGIINFDKFVHLIIFFVQTFLFITAFYRKHPENKRKYLIVPLIVGIATGSGTELLQGTGFINRGSDWFDMLFNTIGAILAVMSFKYINQGYFKNFVKWF